MLCSCRYDPSSPGWVAVLTQQDENKKTGAASKRKTTPAMNKKTTAKKQKNAGKENAGDLIV